MSHMRASTTAPAPLFSKRHYEWLASYWREQQRTAERSVWEQQVMDMVSTLLRDNRAFVCVRFMQACGMTRKEANALLNGQRTGQDDGHHRA